MANREVFEKLFSIIEKLINELNKSHDDKPVKPENQETNWNTLLNQYDGSFAVLQQSANGTYGNTNVYLGQIKRVSNQVTLETSVPFMGMGYVTIPCTIVDEVEKGDGRFLTFMGNGKLPYALYVDVKNAQIQGVRNNDNYMDFGGTEMTGFRLYPGKK